ncbi:hypothetical protein [Streptomyces sp. SID5606]|uniref:hypothetical protein n=1 Tax=Streptomyces sp. SID5606 TaxID=2690305 RepID=UPI0031F9441C
MGKVLAARMVRRAMRPGTTWLVGDDFKAQYPDYFQLLRDDPRSAGAAIRADGGFARSNDGVGTNSHGYAAGAGGAASIGGNGNDGAPGGNGCDVGAGRLSRRRLLIFDAGGLRAVFACRLATTSMRVGDGDDLGIGDVQKSRNPNIG